MQAMRSSLSTNFLDGSPLITPRKTPISSRRLSPLLKPNKVTFTYEPTVSILPDIGRKSSNLFFKTMTPRPVENSNDLPEISLKEVVYQSHSKTLCLTSSLSHRADRMTDKLHRLRTELDKYSVSKRNSKLRKSQVNITKGLRKEFEDKLRGIDLYLAQRGVRLKSAKKNGIEDNDPAAAHLLKNSGIRLSKFILLFQLLS